MSGSRVAESVHFARGQSNATRGEPPECLVTVGATTTVSSCSDLLRVVSGSDRADRRMINSRSKSNSPASSHILDLFAEDSWRNIYAGEGEGRAHH